MYADMMTVNQSQTSACYKPAYLYGLTSELKILEGIYSIYFLIPYVAIIFKRRYYFYIWNLKKIRFIYTVCVRCIILLTEKKENFDATIK